MCKWIKSSSFIIINNSERSISLYKIDAGFKIGNIFSEDNLDKSPQILLSFPVTGKVYVPFAEAYPSDSHVAYTLLSGFIYEGNNANLLPCTPTSDVELPIVIEQQSNITLKIGILFDFTDNRKVLINRLLGYLLIYMLLDRTTLHTNSLIIV